MILLGYKWTELPYYLTQWRGENNLIKVWSTSQIGTIPVPSTAMIQYNPLEPIDSFSCPFKQCYSYENKILKYAFMG